MLAGVLNNVAIVLIKAYKYFISPFLGSYCRFHPSCSRYALEAYQEFPLFTASWLVTKRLCKCHPFGGQGYDPVPTKSTPRKNEGLPCH